MQAILGSGGVIGNGLAKFLPQYTERVRLVSRNPKQVQPSNELMSADLTKKSEVEKAVEGAEVVYLVAGLEYKFEVWQKQWPLIMDNVIAACQAHGAKLVFFDNVYMYGKVNGWMTEDTPNNPSSKKGEVRAEIAKKLMDETKRGNLQALIARSADFYGPGAHNTFVQMMLFDPFKKGKSGNWLSNDQVKHSFTYTPDAAKATALLGNTPDAYNQIWHLPSDKNAPTGKEFIEMAAQAYGVKPKYTVLKKWMMQIVGLFNPLVKENLEMLYQYENDYLFDSRKFDERFFKATPYKEGIFEVSKS
ncbi:SDR family oxidoreductase [soil metagenome]